MKKILLPVAILSISSLATGLYINHQKREVSLLRQKHQAAIVRVEEKYQLEAQKQLKDHLKLLENKKLISGEAAREKRQQEWDKRAQYDPLFGITQREKNILKIISLAKNKSLSNREILQQVTALAAPNNSQIEVSETQKGFHILVSFDMSDMTSGEQGSRTKHKSIESLKKEVVEIMSRVAKDLIEHSGHKGINRISIACTHGVKPSYANFPLNETVVTKTIYRTAITATNIRKIPDWKQIPLHKVANLFYLEHNEFPNLEIKTTTGIGFDWQGE